MPDAPEVNSIPISTKSAPSVDVGRFSIQTTIDIFRWTPRLLSFRITRPSGFVFSAGHYGRLGLRDKDGNIVWRPLSMVSAPADDHLEFVVALVLDGAFSALLAKHRVGDQMLLDTSSFGFLTLDQLAAGRDLWLMASGTGVGPFVSMLRTSSTWEIFENVVVVHSVREYDDLVYRDFFASLPVLRGVPGVRAQFQYLPVVTRQPCPGLLASRVTTLVDNGGLEQTAGLCFDQAHSRIMVCGNPELTRELRARFSVRGFQPARRGIAGNIAFEKYW